VGNFVFRRQQPFEAEANPNQVRFGFSSNTHAKTFLFWEIHQSWTRSEIFTGIIAFFLPYSSENFVFYKTRKQDHT